jgi:hypothetical protein
MRNLIEKARLSITIWRGPPFISLEYNDEWRDLMTILLGIWLGVCCLLLWAKPYLIAWLTQ